MGQLDRRLKWLHLLNFKNCFRFDRSNNKTFIVNATQCKRWIDNSRGSFGFLGGCQSIDRWPFCENSTIYSFFINIFYSFIEFWLTFFYLLENLGGELALWGVPWLSCRGASLSCPGRRQRISSSSSLEALSACCLRRPWGLWGLRFWSFVDVSSFRGVWSTSQALARRERVEHLWTTLLGHRFLVTLLQVGAKEAHVDEKLVTVLVDVVNHVGQIQLDIVLTFSTEPSKSRMRSRELRR